MPKVSVIIPAYNHEDFISDTIQSVLGQTYKDFEVIVIDDGSTDSTKKNLEKFSSDIKIIEQKNSERAVSRNNGVKNSTGKYIAFLDSDDSWKPHKLEIQTNFLDENKDFILTYSGCDRINESGKKIKSTQRQKEGFSGHVFEKLLFRNFVVSSTPLLRREYFEQTTGFNTKYIPYEDWEFWLRVSLLGKFKFISESLVYYRIHPQQSLKTVTAEKIEKITSSLLEDSFNLKTLEKSIKTKSLGLANLRFCYWYLLAEEPETANEKIISALKLYPGLLVDPRWHGLNLICKFPKLKEICNLRQFH